MLYKILWFPARLLIHFYCRKILINKKSLLQVKGPLLIAANHPNSFLDAIVLATLFKNPVYSLARGDAFNGKIISRLLVSLNMLPVYRLSEGTENLDNNYDTFNECRNIFSKGGIVLIFSEGRCINEWHLRSLKKGTARLALSAWQQNIPLKILPLGINYSSFRIFGKNLFLNFGNFITKEDVMAGHATGKAVNEFNEQLKKQLQELVFEFDPADKRAIKKKFFIPQPVLKKIILFLPAVAGWIIQSPLYYAIDLVIRKRASDHYDSIMVGALFFIYPVYVCLVTVLAFLITKSLAAFLLLLLLPFTAWSLLQLKRQ